MEKQSLVCGLGGQQSAPTRILPFRWPLNRREDEYSGWTSRVMMNQNEQFMYWLVREFEEYIRAETDVFETFIEPDDLVLDIGASCGLHTLAMAGLAYRGTVFAVEPQRIPYQYLCGNLALNGCFNVDAARVAVGSSPGMIRVPAVNPFAEVNSGGLSLDPTMEDGDMTTVGTMDMAGLPPFRFVKIDVEGMECDVIAGGLNCIKEYKPVMYIEFTWNRPRILDSLKNLGYVAYRHDAPYYDPNNVLGTPDREPPGQGGRLLSEIVSEMIIGVHKDDRASRTKLEKAVSDGGIKGTVRLVVE